MLHKKLVTCISVTLAMSVLHSDAVWSQGTVLEPKLPDAAPVHAPGSVLSANPTASELCDAGFAAYMAGDGARAIELQERALKLATAQNDTRQMFICMDDLDSCFTVDKAARAANFSRLVDLCEKTPSLYSWMCRTYTRVAGECYLKDDFVACESNLSKARKLAYRVPKPESWQYDTEQMHVVIDLLVNLGNYDQAMAEAKRSLEECQIHKLHPICFARIMRARGECLAAQEKYAEAEKSYQEAMLKLESSGLTYTALYASILFFRSVLHVKTEDLELARAEYERAQTLFEKAPNPGKIELYFRSTRNAELLLRFGRVDAAKGAADFLYGVRKNKFALDGLIVAETKLLLAWTLAAKGQADEAILLANSAMFVLQSKLPASDNRNGWVQWQMAEIQNMCGRKKAAKEYYEKASAIMRAKFGGTSSLYRDCLTKISGLSKDTPYKIAMLIASPVLVQVNNSVPATTDRPQSTVINTKEPVITTMTGTATAAAIAGGVGQFDTKVGDKWALLVGISKFQDAKLNLRFPSKDATDLYHVLIDKLNFAPDHVALLTNQYATRENVISMLGDKWLPRVAAPDDLVLIFLSTHGSPSDLDVGGINYLLAYNTDPHSLYATGIPLQDLVSMVKSRVHSKRVLIVLDACHSGSADVSAKGMVVHRAADADAVAQGTGQMVICSSSPQELSWESKEYQNGVFTHHFIQSLSQSSGMRPLNSVFQSLSDATRNEVMRDRAVLQTPVLRSAWSGNDLYLGAKPSKPRPGLGINIFQSDPSGMAKTTATQSKRIK